MLSCIKSDSFISSIFLPMNDNENSSINTKLMSKRLKILKNMKGVRMWIDGTSYTIKNANNSTDNDVSAALEKEHKLFNITTDEEGKSKTSFRLPSPYYQKLNEDRNFDLKVFQNKTNTQLLIPKRGSTENLSIIGDNYESVVNARDEMHLILNEIRKKNSALQFISVPTLSQDIQNKFLLFKKEVLHLNIRNMEDSIFQKPEKLHLTVVVFSLLDDIEKVEVVRALQSCKTDVIDKYIKDGPLKIKLMGIDCMHSNIRHTNVLYAKGEFENPTDDCNLQKMLNETASYFEDKGFSKEYKDNVKIHVTLINTKYRKGNSSQRWQKRRPFDATSILEKYKDYDFGTCNLDAIHLSLMGGAVGEDGFYKPLTVVKL